ncbi:MAG: CRISPR-associated helicase Cas3', partial [Amphritea sp.]|nr:CRISPR-associated helicase Cas3' [Amphritea sp.]
MSEIYYRYWGKARPAQSAEARPYHLLCYHSLDVAAVIWQLLQPERQYSKRLCDRLNVDPAWLQRWFSFCAALHDLGKFSSAFQGLVPDLSEDLVGPDATKAYAERHDTLGFMLWDRQLKQALWQGAWQSQQHWSRLKSGYRAVEPWLKIVTGHHGEPPKESAGPELRNKPLNLFYSDTDCASALGFTEAVCDLFQPDLLPLADEQQVTQLNQVSWQLAGLMVLADWSGSDQAVFTYHSEPMPLAEYWDKVALPGASEAVARMKPEPVSSAPFRSVSELFPFIKCPTPLQQQAESVAIPDAPQLWILEDVTGAGKTEAALTLTSRIMSAGLADGVYIGLPTMATANGMYQRMYQSYRALFTEDSQPSLVLAHGGRELSAAFRDSVQLSLQSADQQYDKQREDISASAYCSSWVADNRKKSLFADVGVGTIDQTLLAVLPARHQSLRLIGLRDKVLLVDEVHAYDDYMQRLLCALLEAHAAQGGSVIMLSATLPQAMRNEYLNAYRRGRELEPHLLESQSQAYPLMTGCVGSVQEYPVASRACVSRTLAVTRIDELSAVEQRIREAINSGQSVCWIRNTVDDAREAYALALQQNWADADKTMLFHSRFAMCDRQWIEENVLQRFGKDSAAAQRNGQLLIATQVIEQSLDLDFDLMISDLAPIDLLIQRAGRLHRHNRDAEGNPAAIESRTEPTFCIYAPEASDQADTQWLLPHWRGTAAVYRHTGQLWLTLKAIEQQNWTITMPEAARDLIESVYSDEAQNNYPEALQDASL